MPGGRANRRTLVRASTLLLGASAWLAASPARAGSFGSDGTFYFDPAAVAKIDFEGDAPMGVTPKADKGALSGNNVIAVPGMAPVDITVPMPAARATYRVSLWIRDA